MVDARPATQNRAPELDTNEDAMTWKLKRPSGPDTEWITARQAFVGTCWAALFAACVLDQVAGPLFH
jgi:hypothetical protein